MAVGLGAPEVAPSPGRVVDMDICEGMTAVADQMGLERAITNLLVNAYRYGGPRVRVEAEAVGREVVVTVSDNGDGVPADLVPHSVRSFTRGAATGGSRDRGSACHHATPHRELRRPDRLMSRACFGSPLQPASPKGGLTVVAKLVLIVEDDPDISLAMSVSLRLAGHDVATAPTGEAALASLTTTRPDVLVLDLGLPGIGGREVLSAVVGPTPRWRHCLWWWSPRMRRRRPPRWRALAATAT